LRFRLAELLLAVAFLGLFAAVVARTRGSWSALMGPATAGIVLPLAYLVLVIALRQHEGRRRDGPR
jgi:hypothetical protein